MTKVGNQPSHHTVCNDNKHKKPKDPCTPHQQQPMNCFPGFNPLQGGGMPLQGGINLNSLLPLLMNILPLLASLGQGGGQQGGIPMDPRLLFMPPQDPRMMQQQMPINPGMMQPQIDPRMLMMQMGGGLPMANPPQFGFPGQQPFMF